MVFELNIYKKKGTLEQKGMVRICLVLGEGFCEEIWKIFEMVKDKNVCEEIVVLAKFHLRGKRVKTEISALSGSTRLCLGCFNPCVCH